MTLTQQQLVDAVAQYVTSWLGFPIGIESVTFTRTRDGETYATVTLAEAEEGQP